MQATPVKSFLDAYVEIVEQPTPNARFRYESEGSPRPLTGQNWTLKNKTFPKIRVVGYKGPACVVVSCVTKDQPYRPHPHNLAGKENCKKGVCTLKIPTDTMSVQFTNIGIRCVKIRDIEHSLDIREEICVDPFRTGFAHKSQSSSIDINTVRLCFQVILEPNGREILKRTSLAPIVSEPIINSKSGLEIFRLSSSCSSVAGGDTILMFCEKVVKDDIAVRFYEENTGWNGFGEFKAVDVHRQVGIAFKTPAYCNQNITEPVNVFIHLYRPSDNACSDSLAFQYTPRQEVVLDKQLGRKRSKVSTPTDNFDLIQHLEDTSQVASPDVHNLLSRPATLPFPSPSSSLSPMSYLSPGQTNTTSTYLSPGSNVSTVDYFQPVLSPVGLNETVQQPTNFLGQFNEVTEAMPSMDSVQSLNSFISSIIQHPTFPVPTTSTNTTLMFNQVNNLSPIKMEQGNLLRLFYNNAGMNLVDEIKTEPAALSDNFMDDVNEYVEADNLRMRYNINSQEQLPELQSDDIRNGFDRDEIHQLSDNLSSKMSFCEESSSKKT